MTAPRDWRPLRRTAANLGVGLLAWVAVAVLAVYSVYVLKGCAATTNVKGGETHIERQTKEAAPTVEHRTGTTKHLGPTGAILAVDEWVSEVVGGETVTKSIKAEAHGASGQASGDKATLNITGDAPIIATSEGDSGSGGTNRSTALASIVSGSGLRSPFLWVGVLFVLGAVWCVLKKPLPALRGALVCAAVGLGLIVASFCGPLIQTLVLGGALLVLLWPYLHSEFTRAALPVTVGKVLGPVESALDGFVHGLREAPEEVRKAVEPFIKAQLSSADADAVAASVRRGGYQP